MAAALFIPTTMRMAEGQLALGHALVVIHIVAVIAIGLKLLDQSFYAIRQSTYLISHLLSLLLLKSRFPFIFSFCLVPDKTGRRYRALSLNGN